MSDQKIENLVNALTDILSAKEKDETQVSLDFSIASFIKFESDSGKGLLWVGGKDYTKQFVFNRGPDRFFSSESIELAKGKVLSINGVTALTEQELGSSITKSNLTTVGKLKNLLVDGSLTLNNYVFFDPNTDRLGLGTDQPNAALDITDEGTNIILGSREYNKAGIGTFNSTDVELITDNTTRITIGADGNIELGNRNFGPVNVKVYGTLGINVNNADPRSRLHVDGAIKFNNVIHLRSDSPPAGGSYNIGDIVWNSNPRQKSFIGWVCVKEGNPGIWCPFGEIR